MRLALTGCSWCYVTMGSCSNSSVQLQKEDIERLRCTLSRLKRTMTMGSCSNSSVQLNKEDIERLRCKPSRLKRAGELYEIGSDWMLSVLCDNGFVFKQLCSAM